MGSTLILDGTSHTAPPRHACTSLRPPDGEASGEAGDEASGEAGDEASGEASREEAVRGEATPAPVPGMEELWRWRDGLDEVTRRDFEARCYLLRSELEVRWGAVGEGGEEEREEVVWRAAWGEVTFGLL